MYGLCCPSVRRLKYKPIVMCRSCETFPHLGIPKSYRLVPRRGYEELKGQLRKLCERQTRDWASVAFVDLDGFA